MRRSRVLVMWPPHVPSYFNAGHHLPVFLVAQYLRVQCGDHVDTVEAIDAGALNHTWKDVADVLKQGDFDVVAVMNDYDAIDGIGRIARYARELSPRAQILTFGRLSSQIPRFFTRYDLDAIVASGDYEAGVAAYVAALAQTGGETAAPGVLVRDGAGWHEPERAGRLLDADEWVLPDVDEIPYEAYDFMYRRDANKFCGIPERRELVVPLARGCPVRCRFCEVPALQGVRERRLSVERTLAYIEDAFARGPFEYVSFYAPTFTLSRAWVESFCAQLIDRGTPFPWKCVTTIHHLEEPLVAAMGEAGCVRISVGLETLDPGGHVSVPRIKRIGPERLEQIGSWCEEAGIELNCFVILGLPGTTAAGAEETVRRVRALHARVRPTIYMPIEQLDADMTEAEVAMLSRQLVAEELPADERLRLYELAFGPEPSPTQVMRRIERVEASAAVRS